MDVVRATPLTDGYFAGIDHATRLAIADLDAEAGDPIRSLGHRLREWESLPARLTSGETLYIYEYLNDLDIRDGLERTRDRLPAEALPAYEALLAQLDQGFKDVTVPDDTGVIRRRYSADPPQARPPLWWARRPGAISLEE